MNFSGILSLGQTALELGLTCALTVLALFLSYSMLNVCDLSTDGCFTLGATVGAVVALAGHPYLSLPAAMAAGVCSGFVTAFLQTRMGIDSLLSGIDTGRLIREGISCAIVGKPNVGKSTLMNLLSGEERSIVSAIAGTTRDVVEETVNLGGIVLKIADLRYGY